MGPTPEPRYAQAQFHFPPSPPSSGNVTAAGSPRIPMLSVEDPATVQKFLDSTSYRHSTSLAHTRDEGRRRADSDSESEGYNTERTGAVSLSAKRTRTSHPRAYTLPPNSNKILSKPLCRSPTKLARAPSRAKSPSSSEDSSSDSGKEKDGEDGHSGSGVSRKVAATLQLFKETAPVSEDVVPSEPSSSRAESSRRSTFPGEVEGTEPQFEFVKRSEWPEREARREQSMAGYERSRGREDRGKERPATSHDSYHDLPQWRHDVLASIRGRRRERPSDEDVHDDSPEPFPPFKHPSSFVYPPSPSLSRSPSHCRHTLPSDLDHDLAFHHISTEPSLSPIAPDIPFPERPSTPFERPPSPLESASTSPYTTDDDDESLYDDSASIASLSTTSTSYYPSHHDDDAGTPSSKNKPLPEEGARHSHLPFSSSDDDEFDEQVRASRVRRRRTPHNMSEEQLPHIPLRPFRNQVGGHSAIYKFTRQAVCKPLVSRENLFYEAVEREAPPLLDFIPRYLGVMLVSYRRVPKSPQPPNIAGASSPDRLPLSSTPPSTTPPLDGTIDIRRSAESDQTASHTPEATELPEVFLDRNRHIVPEWLLQGRRNRSLSYSKGSIVARRQLCDTHLRQGTSSTPELATLPDCPTTPSAPRPSPLATLPPLSTEDTAPTPVNSPSHAPRPFLVSTSLGERLDADRRFDHGTTSDDDVLGRSGTPVQRHRPWLPERVASVPGSPWFGGTGSTVVNTKLKDHVFNSVLRRLRKRRRRSGSGLCSRSSQHLNEGEGCGNVADVECELNQDQDAPTPSTSPASSSRISRALFRDNKPAQSESGEHEDEHSDQHALLDDVCQTPIRRIVRESLLGKEKERETHVRGEEGMGIFDMDLKDDDSNHHAAQRGRSLDSLRHRSLSPSSLPSVPATPSETTPPANQVYQPFIHSAIVEEDDLHLPAPVLDADITRQDNFILMEDLTGRLKHPCVMDVKMGTRQYGLDATYAKKKSQRAKCKKTTSAELGVRVCGMQVWNHATQSYVTQDKYRGRNIKPAQFDSVIESFLFDGERLLAYQIPVLLQKLYALARIINRLKGFRFYGCSLLLIYDGDKESQEVFRTTILEQPWTRSKRGESLERRGESQARSSEKPTLRRSHSEDLLWGPVAQRQGRRKKRGEINVRIVDFAHTTTGRDWLPYPTEEDRVASIEALNKLERDKTQKAPGYHTDVDPESGLLYARFPPHYPDEPDRGFLFGLKKLTESLEGLWNRERIRRIKAARDDPEFSQTQLAPLPTDGKEIFDEIFSESGYVST